MRTVLIFLAFFTLAPVVLTAQYGYGYRSRFGRSAIPQAEAPAKKPEPLTAEQIVAAEMPEIIEAAGLNDFESAVVSTILTKYVQQRIELRILKLDPDQTREAYEKIDRAEREELESGLPPEKFQAMVELKESGYDSRKLQKKKKKKKKKKT